MLTEATRLLQEEDLDTPHLDAELLLSHVLGLTRSQIHTHPNRRLDAAELDSYRELIKRRRQHEPVAYIIGHKEFYGLDFYVDRRVLIPRPETELLVEKGLEIGQAVSHPLTIADVGTGCGAIAISLAVHLSQAIIYALDALSKALEVAALNCRRHSVERPVHLLQGDLLSPLPEPVDLIVANLPYVREPEMTGVNTLGFEPQLALNGGPDGLNKTRYLCLQAGEKLRPGGYLLLEIGQGQGKAVTAFLTGHFPAAGLELIPDLSGIDRMVSLSLTGSA